MFLVWLRKEEGKKMEGNSLNVFDLADLRQEGCVITYKDKFMMGDNLGKKIDWSLYGKYLNLYPTKSQCTLVLFCSKGDMRIRINFKDYRIGAFNAVVIMPSVISQVLEISEDAELVFMAFSDNTFFASFPTDEMVDIYGQLQESPVLVIQEDKYDLFINVYRMMRADMEDEEFSCKSEALLGYIQLLTAHARHWIFSCRRNAVDANEMSRSSQLYMQFMRLVNEYHSQHRDVAFYAERMYLSPKYMAQVVLTVSGRYALDIIRDQVIFEAKALLKSRRYSVQEVAYMLNFPNPSAFGRYFRDETGCSPRTYMNSDEV